MGPSAEVERQVERAAPEPVDCARAPGSASPSAVALHDVSAVDVHAPVVSAPDDAGERQAGRVADDVMEGRRPIAPASREGVGKSTSASGPGLSERAAAGVQAIGGGEPLDAVTRSFMETSFARDFSRVRVHTGTAAAESALSLNARAYATGNDIVFGGGAYAPHTNSGRRLLAHELAHVAQQGPSSADGHHVQRLIQRQPTSLAGIPATERRVIKVGVTDVTVPPQEITEFFTVMPSGRPSTTQSVGATNSFGTGIPASLQTGLGSVAAWVAAKTNALPINTSIEVDLDLTAHGGARTTYRFTYFDHNTGRGRRASSSQVMLIEQVGAALAAPTQQTVPANRTLTVGRATFRLLNTWSGADYTTLHQAISLLPAAALTTATGISFRRVRTGPGTEGGHYDPATDTIELNDRAFRASNLRIGQHARAVRDVLHEVGHALDLRVLERAWQTFNAAGQTRAARTTLMATRSRSGSRYVDVPGGNYEVQEARSDVTPAFRAAARRDGVRSDTSGRAIPEGTTATLRGGVTSYSETDYQELYAESFALYVSAPDTLRLLRPAIFAHFQRAFPRP